MRIFKKVKSYFKERTERLQKVKPAKTKTIPFNQKNLNRKERRKLWRAHRNLGPWSMAVSQGKIEGGRKKLSPRVVADTFRARYAPVRYLKRPSA